MMSSHFNFKHASLVIEEIGPPITEEQIVEAIREDFPGKEGFAAFYLTHNGVCFRPAAICYRSRFQQVKKGDYERLEVDNFYFIPRFAGDDVETMVSMVDARAAMARWRPELRDFIQAHLPFACDASGNDFWIEFLTGRIKYRPLEEFESEKDLVDVAPSFIDFAVNLEAWSAARRPASP
jgi:hypothetical protein